MTIYFSTNIPEMRAISTFNRVSTNISEIQRRITTGQRINSGKDDPGGLIVREGMRADIKNINAAQAGMNQAEILMNTAANGMSQLLELLNGGEPANDNGGLLGELNGSMTDAQKQNVAKDFMNLYDSIVTTTTYNGQKLIGGDLSSTPKDYQLGDGVGKLQIGIADFSSATGGAAAALAAAVVSGSYNNNTAIAAATALQTAIAGELGYLGGKQKVAAQALLALDSRLTSVTESEGRISNIDLAAESSRLARSELLAQNAMNSITYNQSYAAFAVNSLFG
ncbi:MAG: hypothetical protein LBT46_10885 [Planctomycetaceae bacterium]|jgi:flagellin-like hook-associated protein FlgL|nr:hypothetical protein [Planctomycetaceae bacterium]